MMAFLLDIITFLQISFSTNIFRINYISRVNNHPNHPIIYNFLLAKKTHTNDATLVKPSIYGVVESV
ncbi:hypothetical protein IB639_06015 [Francisella tularensis subsp. tularensis]|nr:hypothetical protein [Francisella tularensis]MBK2037625.1 hypothetical protein [Francisella tularensis subsp. tularensis]MBK2041038.1 hypothetical protein [Francisella tularensis subsp. tularensis]QXF53676.1 hypothetical protein KCX61_09345 [Francisella tularensis]